MIPMAPFGRNILDNKNDTLVLGKLYHMGHNEECGGKKQEVCIDIEVFLCIHLLQVQQEKESLQQFILFLISF